MKKLYKILVCMLVMFCVLPICVFAGASPEKMHINAQINHDGSMTVEENITWTIEESINGVYRDILCYNHENEWNSAEEIYVDSVIVDGKEYYYSEETLGNGDFGMYNLIRIEGGTQIKIFHPSDEYNVQTIIKYTLTDVVTEYADIAELYWNFLGKGWAGGIENATIKINLPKASKILKIFGHGPLDGYSKIIDERTVEFYIPYLRNGDAVDARVLFDKDLVYAAKYQDQNMYETIMAEEAVLAEKANQKRTILLIFSTIVSLLSIAILIYIIVTYVTTMKKTKKIDLQLRYYRELPEDYGVPVMNYLLHGYHKDNENMLATLMDLVRKKYVAIEEISEKKKSKKDYRLKLIKQDLSELNNIEQHYITNMIFVNCTEITLKELKAKNTKSIKARRDATEELTKWQRIIKKEYNTQKFERQLPQQVRKAKIMLTLCWIPIIIMFITTTIMEFDLALAFTGLNFILYLYLYFFMINNINKKNKMTIRGLEHKIKWKAFKKFLKDFSRMEEKDYGSIILWEHYLVYAIGLGVADKVLKQLKAIYPEIMGLEDYNTNIYYHHNSFRSFSNSFNTASTRAFTYSSSNGLGGGFSGGGGGRRRRWWRRRILKRL